MSTTGALFPFRTAIPISDIGILSAISQATTEATLRFTADAGRTLRAGRVVLADFLAGLVVDVQVHVGVLRAVSKLFVRSSRSLG